MSLAEVVVLLMFVYSMEDVNREAYVIEVVVLFSVEGGNEVTVVVVEDITGQATREPVGIKDVFQPHLSQNLREHGTT